MKQTLDIYFLSKHVEKASKKTNPEFVVKPLTIDVMSSYKKYHRFTSDRKLRFIFGLAVQRKYMKEVQENDQDLGGWEVKKIKLSDKGLRLIDTYPFIPIPSGLLQAWWKEDNMAVKLILALIFGGFGVAIWQIFGTIYHLVVR